MLLTITTTHRPADDLGYLLFKHPGRVQSFTESMGTAHVFYPQVGADSCTAALLLEVDPIRLVRRGKVRDADGFALGSYVNDRPYAAGSMLALTLKSVFGTAMTGRCAARPELAATAIPLQIHLPALRCRGGADLLGRLLEPLGWQIEATAVDLDPVAPEWGRSPYLDARLTGELRLADALRQLYVLLPVLDDAKHYWVSDDEVDKLIRAGEGWLAGHPEKDLITRRYLAHQGTLTRTALPGWPRSTRPPRPSSTTPNRRRSSLNARCGSPSCAAAPCSPPSGPPAPERWATSAAARALSCGTCWPTGRWSGSWPSTCPPGRCRSPPSGCIWTG